MAKKILIVDDEVDVLSVLKKGLAAEGYSVITADNGCGALGLAQSKHPDLIILDILMPNMDGTEVAEKLKETLETKNIPVIFLTGMFPKREGDQNCRTIAGNIIFDKPYDILRLINVIENTLLEKQILLE